MLFFSMICQNCSNLSFNIEDCLVYSLTKNFQRAIKGCLDAVQNGSFTLTYSCKIHLVIRAIRQGLESCSWKQCIFDSNKDFVLVYSHILRCLRFLHSKYFASESYDLYASAIMKLHKIIFLHILQNNNQKGYVLNFVKEHILHDFSDHFLILLKDVSVYDEIQKEILNLQCLAQTISANRNFCSNTLENEYLTVFTKEFWKSLHSDIKSYLGLVLLNLPESKLAKYFETNSVLMQQRYSFLQCEDVILSLLECVLQGKCSSLDPSSCFFFNNLTSKATINLNTTLESNLTSHSGDGKSLFSSKPFDEGSTKGSLSCTNLNPSVVLVDLKHVSLDKIGVKCSDLLLLKNKHESGVHDITTRGKKPHQKIPKILLVRKKKTETTPETIGKKPRMSIAPKPKTSAPEINQTALGSWQLCYSDEYKDDKENITLSNLKLLSSSKLHPDNGCLSCGSLQSKENNQTQPSIRRKLFNITEPSVESFCDDFMEDSDDEIIDESDCSDDDDSIILSLDTNHIPDFSKFFNQKSNSRLNPTVSLRRL